MYLARSSPTVLTWFMDASSSGLQRPHSGTPRPPGASTPSDPSICWMLASLAVAGAFRASSALLLAFGRKIGGPSPVQGKRAVTPVDPTSQRQSALSSLGGVLEHGGCPTAHLVQDLRLVLIRIAREVPLRNGPKPGRCARNRAHGHHAQRMALLGH